MVACSTPTTATSETHRTTLLPLTKAFRKSFQVVAPDESRIDLKRWKVSSPRANTRDTLVVSIPKPLAYGLLQRTIGVQATLGDAFVGVIQIGRNETEWRFVPLVVRKP